MNLLLASLLYLNLQTDQWVVCHVDGTVIFEVNKKDTVKVGRHIKATDGLLYSGAGAQLVVVSAKGVFEVKNRKPLPGQQLNNVLLVVRDHILPGTSTGQMHTRGSGGALINLQAMQEYLASLSDEEAPKLLLVNDIRFCLHQQTFSKRDKQFFFLRYNYQGKQVNEKLPYIEPKQADGPLFLSIPQKLFVKNNVLLDTAAIKDVQLYYQLADTPEPVLISALSFSFANRQSLLEELKVVVQQLGNTHAAEYEKKEGLQKLLADYLQDQYGWVDAEQLPNQFPELFK